MIGRLIDIFHVRGYFAAATQLRDLGREAREDADFVAGVRRALLKLPTDGAAAVSAPVWRGKPHPLRRKPRRLGIVATGGSGALASLLGVLRGCDELGVRPAVMSFASGAALFAFPVAAGKSPDEVARFVLGLDPAAWVDPDWLAVGAIVPKQGRGFTGIMKGERVEASFAELLGSKRLGDLDIPAYSPVWNIERNRLEYIGPRTHPDLTVARAIRMSVALPLFFEPVRWRGGSWNDGAIVDIFPVHPVLDIEPPCDAVLGVNCFYPPGFAGEDAAGFGGRRWSMLDIADQVMTAQHLQLARENERRLRAEVKTVMMTQPVAYGVVRRAGLYAQFIDRTRWPEFMRQGRRQALKALTDQFG
jgi:NTE family protein